MWMLLTLCCWGSFAPGCSFETPWKGWTKMLVDSFHLLFSRSHNHYKRRNNSHLLKKKTYFCALFIFSVVWYISPFLKTSIQSKCDWLVSHKVNTSSNLVCDISSCRSLLFSVISYPVKHSPNYLYILSFVHSSTSCIQACPFLCPWDNCSHWDVLILEW